MLPANLGLAEAELVLSGKMGREMTLKRALREPAALRPDPGRLPARARAAHRERVVAADYALLSTEAQYFSLQGVEQALEVIELAKESLHPDLEWLGVVLNIADLRTDPRARGARAAQERFGEKVFESVIRASIRTRSRPSGGCRSSTTGPTWAPTTSRWPRRRSSAWLGDERARVAELRAELVTA